MHPHNEPLDAPNLPDFGDRGAVMEWADSWVANNQPSILHELEMVELAHRRRFEGEYGRGIQQFYVEFGALVDAVDDVNFAERDHWPPFRYVQFVLLAKNLGSLHSAMDRLSRGFYQDALSLTRSSYDAWLRLVFISCYPDDPYAALMHRTPKGTPSFNATDLVRVQLRLDWLSKYRIMSAFAHGNSVDALQSLQAAIERSGNPERFGLQQSYDVSRIELVYPFLEFLVLAYLRFVVERLLAPHEARTPGVHHRAEESIAFIRHKFTDHPKPYWHATMTDLDYVFELLAAADRGDDWRAIRDTRPEVPDDTP
jgi:hypothetical protein